MTKSHTFVGAATHRVGLVCKESMVKDVISITAVHSLTMDASRERLVLGVDMLRAGHIAAT